MIFDSMHDEDSHMMDWWFDLFGPYAWIFMMLGWVLYFVVGIIIAYYIHKDAVKRGNANPEVWILIALIFNVLALIVYLLTRNNYREEES